MRSTVPLSASPFYPVFEMKESTRTVLQLVEFGDEGDVAHRMSWPGEQLARQRPEWRVVNLNARAKERLTLGRSADLLVLYQSNDCDLLPLIQERRSKGLKTAVEYNDNFYEPALASPTADAWSNPILWQTYETFLKEADAVIVTGPGLEELFTGKTKAPITQLKNSIHHELKPFETLWAAKGEKPTIGWAGSLGHMADLLSLRPLFLELLEHFPELTIKLMGNASIPSELRLPESRFTFTPWGSMEEYLKFWSGVQIGLAPLLDHPYNHCRSDVKAIEMASAGVLPIVTELLPYEAFLKGTKLPSFRSHKDLLGTVTKYLKDPPSIRKDAKKAYEYVKERRLAHHSDDRAALYESLFPDEGQNLDTKLMPGYHQLSGSIEQHPSFALRLAKARTLAQEKKLKEAEAVFNDTEWHSDNEFFRLELRRALGVSTAPEELEKAAERFPLDLRFRLSLIESIADAAKKQRCWGELISTLERSSPAFQRYFGRQVIDRFCRSWREGNASRDQLMKLAALYPGSIALLIERGKLFEREGDEAEALSCFEQAHRLLDEQTVNAPSEGSRRYVATWEAALQGRRDRELAPNR